MVKISAQPDPVDGTSNVLAEIRNVLRRKWPLLFVLLGLAIVLLGGIVGIGFVVIYVVRETLHPQVTTAENRSKPRTDEEELVKRYILNNSEDAKAVKFLKWGPHMTGKEIVSLLKEAHLDREPNASQREALAEIEKMILVRVCWTESNVVVPGAIPDKDEEYDLLFWVKGKTVQPLRFGSVCLVFGAFGDMFDISKPGDNWKKDLRRRMAKRFPAIKVD